MPTLTSWRSPSSVSVPSGTRTSSSCDALTDTSGRCRSIWLDRKSTRLNSSHDQISYAVFCLKKKNTKQHRERKLPPDLPDRSARPPSPLRLHHTHRDAVAHFTHPGHTPSKLLGTGRRPV